MELVTVAIDWTPILHSGLGITSSLCLASTVKSSLSEQTGQFGVTFDCRQKRQTASEQLLLSSVSLSVRPEWNPALG